MKSIRNNWITQKLQKISYDDDWTTKWDYIKRIYEKEKNAIAKLSKLIETASSRKTTERQNVSLCLKVFCDKTTAALKLQNDLPDDIIEFLTNLVKFFKIANGKGQFEDVHTKDETRAVLSSPDDERLNFLLSLADLVEKMSCEMQGVRVEQLTKDTFRDLLTPVDVWLTSQNTFCKALLLMYVLYVCLGHFSSDLVEKMFDKLRQGLEGICFIKVQKVLQKVAIHKTKLCLDLSVSFDEQSLSSDHSCEKCSYFVNREVPVDVFHNLPELKQSLTKEVKMALVYIAGYVAKKTPTEDDMHVYVDKYGAYLKELNRGVLTFPGDSVCQ